MTKKTNLQKKKQLERSRRDARVRQVKKYNPLCISKGFIEYAYNKKWDDTMVDAAALIMHYYFTHLKKIYMRGWMPIPHEVFESMFGSKYRVIIKRLMSSGFLLFNKRRLYSAGSHCSEFMICDELRNDRVSASYRLQSEELQERYIAHKKHWEQLKNMMTKEYQEMAAYVIESTFAQSGYYYRLVRQGKITEEQFQTIKRLAANAHLLKLSIDQTTVERIATERYDRKYSKLEVNYDLDAYIIRLLGKAEAVVEAKVSIDEYGRHYTPKTNVPREYWDYIYYQDQQLAGVDTKNSHVICLLTLLKDISINYFGTSGTHEERLDNCQFSKQIKMIPGLREHLRTIIIKILLSAHNR